MSLARSGACAAHARSTGSAHSPRSNLECAGRGTTLQNLDAKLGVRRQAVSRATPLSSASGVQKRRRSRRPDEQTLVPPGAPRDESWAGGRVSPRAALPLCGRIFRGSLRSTGRGKCHLPAAALRAAPPAAPAVPAAPPQKNLRNLWVLKNPSHAPPKKISAPPRLCVKKTLTFPRAQTSRSWAASCSCWRRSKSEASRSHSSENTSI